METTTRTIPELLDLAKQRNGLKSDRQLGAMLGRSNITPYRTKGEIPNDATAIRLAELCGMPAAEVLLLCHIERMKQVADGKQVSEVYADLLAMFREASKKAAAVAFLALGLGLSSPSPAEAAHGISQTAIHGEIFIMRRFGRDAPPPVCAGSLPAFTYKNQAPVFVNKDVAFTVSCGLL